MNELMMKYHAIQSYIDELEDNLKDAKWELEDLKTKMPSLWVIESTGEYLEFATKGFIFASRSRAECFEHVRKNAFEVEGRTTTDSVEFEIRPDPYNHSDTLAGWIYKIQPYHEDYNKVLSVLGTGD